MICPISFLNPSPDPDVGVVEGIKQRVRVRRCPAHRGHDDDESEEGKKTDEEQHGYPLDLGVGIDWFPATCS